jgi:type 1 glutamine amidotransferase
MKTLRTPGLLLVLTLLWMGSSRPTGGAEPPPEATRKIRIVLIHGGHDFQTNDFLRVFKENPDISFQTAEYPQAQAWFAAEKAADYDVLVFYDMWQTISDQAKIDLVNRLKEGKGLVALHHSLASFQEWDEYARIIGGRYHLKKWNQNGVEKAGSTYLHDVDFKVRVADPGHPVTQGLQDFAIHDETYGGFEVGSEAHVLLTTDAPTSGPAIGWSKTYGPARVVYIQLGHDRQAYENPNYRRLVRQAILWVARPTKPS